MSILGTGIDIVETNRLKKLLLKKKSNFKNKIFTNNEIAYCEKKSNITNCYSKRFAAKEAFVKAVSTGFRNNINFKDIEVVKNHYGKPSLLINKKVINKIKTFLGPICSISVKSLHKNKRNKKIIKIK